MTGLWELIVDIQHTWVKHIHTKTLIVNLSPPASATTVSFTPCAYIQLATGVEHKIDGLEGNPIPFLIYFLEFS